MKKIVSSVFVACLGGIIALGASHFMYENKGTSHQIVAPAEPSSLYRFANYTGASSPESTNNFVMAAERSVNSVVHIKTISEHVNNLSYDPFAELFFGQPKRQQSYIQQGSGSGVIISQDGYIVTNNHVIAGSDKIEVTLNDRRTYEATVIGADASTDIALIKIKETNLPFLPYGNSDQVRVGEWALAVGNPFNLNSTVTAGIISAKGRNNILSGNKRPIESFIQTDAAVNPGNSGGALVNTNGELIGINTAIASNNGAYQGYSFAVPVNIVKKVVSDMAEFGTVQRAYIGVSIQDINAKFAEEKKLKQLTGIYVNGLTTGGSAEEAGVKKGDVITAIQDVPVNSMSELQEQISRYRPGDKVNVDIQRKDKKIVIPVVLKSLDNTTRLVKKSEIVKMTTTALGADLQDIDTEELDDMRIENGVRVQKLNPGRLAQTGMQPGFIITHIDKKKMNSAEETKKRLEKSGPILIEGFYLNGMRASYSFSL